MGTTDYTSTNTVFELFYLHYGPNTIIYIKHVGEISLFQMRYLWSITGREGDRTGMATNGNHVLSSIEFNTNTWKG